MSDSDDIKRALDLMDGTLDGARFVDSNMRIATLESQMNGCREALEILINSVEAMSGMIERTAVELHVVKAQLAVLNAARRTEIGE